MVQNFGVLPTGEKASLYLITNGKLAAKITDYGAAVVNLYVPDKDGKVADVVLGYDDCNGYRQGTCYFGATIGRNSNRIGGASFVLNGETFTVPANENGNSLHSGPDGYDERIWTVEKHTPTSITLCLNSPDGDQGYPGNAVVRVTYTLEDPAVLAITYDAVSDKDTVFNLTNHSYFNLAGHENQEKAMEQTLMMPARFFNPDDAEAIPTGELRSVEGTPMDFRSPKPLGRDIGQDYDALNLQGGYDHNFEVYCNPCAVLHDPSSGRTMEVRTDCPGVQLYAGNFAKGAGKGGVVYRPRCAVCLETQFYPDAIHHPEWPQPVTKAGAPYHSETRYVFSW